MKFVIKPAFYTTIATFFMLSSFSTLAETVPQDSPAAQRATELAKLFDSGDRKLAQTYIQKNYTPKFLEMPVEVHLNFISMFHDQSHGIESYRIQSTSPTSAILLTQSKLTHTWSEVTVTTEPKPPYRIDGIRVEAHSKENKSLKKLDNSQIAIALDKYLKKLADADVFSGAVLLAQNGHIFFEKAYGEADKNFHTPNNISTKFNLGSMNKMFTAVAIAQLVEAGKLSFDDPLSKFMPDFPNKEDAKKIKIKHLLSHTSGLGNYFNKKFMDSSRARFLTVDDMLTLVADDKKLEFEPGTKWQYSNTGFLVLGKIIETKYVFE